MNRPHLNHTSNPSSSKEAGVNPVGVPLTSIERRDLVRLETEVRHDLQAFLRVGRALLEIKRRKLYRENYHSFEEYCYAVWGWKKSQAYRMLDAAEICSEMSPMGDTVLPTNERQVRPLRGLSGTVAAKAWKLAVINANGKPITGKMVSKAAAEVQTPVKPTKHKEMWQVYIEPVLKQAATRLKEGDREEFEALIRRISCLLLVGKGPSLSEENPHNLQ